MEPTKAFLAATFVLLFSSPAFADGPDRPTEEEVRRARERVAADFAGAAETASLKGFVRAGVMEKYAHLDPKKIVPPSLLEDAVVYFDANKAKFANDDFVTIVDFRLRSDRARLFLIDLRTGAVETYHTTHGQNSDKNRDGVAEAFSNVENSLQSSIGFVRTGEVYTGAYRRSMRLDGLSSTNSRMRSRAIVLHGWDHVWEADKLQGLTQGCIALDWDVKDSVIDRIRDGSLMLLGVSRPGGN